MENKTLKPGQLATVQDGFIGVRGIVRASKKVALPCLDCSRQNDHKPCGYLMSLGKCQQMFGWDMYPIVIFSTLWTIKKH